MLNLGNLQFTVGVNTRALDGALQAFEQFGNLVQQVQNRANKGADVAIGSYRRIENSILAASEKLNDFIHRVERAKLAPDIKTNLIRDAEAAYAGLVNQATNYKNVTDNTNLDRATAQYRNLMSEGQRTLNVLIDAERELEQEARDNAKADRDWANALRQVNQELDRGWKAVQNTQRAAQNAKYATRETENAAAMQGRFNQMLRQTSGIWDDTSRATKSARASMDVFVEADKRAAAATKEANREARALAAAAKDAATAAERLAKAQQATANATERATLSQQKALASAMEKGLNLGQRIELSGLDTKQITALSDRLQMEMNKLRTALTGPEPLKPREFQQAANTYNQSLGQINRNLRTLRAEAIQPANEDFNMFRQRMANLGSTMLLLNGHLGGMSTRFIALASLSRDFSTSMVVAAGAVTAFAVGAVALVKGSLQAAMKLEKVEKSLIAVTGSAAVARDQLEFLIDVANQSGQVYTELAAGYSRFVAASTSAGQAMSVTEQQFKDIAMAAGVMSLSVDDTKGVYRAFEQMLSKGTVQAEELRGQLGDRLPGAFAIASKAMQMNERDLNKLMKAGDLVTRDFLPKFIEELKRTYNIADGVPIDTLQAALNRLTNAVELFFAALASNTKMLAAAKAILGVTADVVVYLTENMDELIDNTLKMTAAVAGAAAGWFALQVVMASGTAITATAVAVTSLTRALAAATVGARTLTVTLGSLYAATSVIGGLVAIVARLALAIGAAVVGWKLMDKWINNSNASFQAGISEIQGYIENQRLMGVQVERTTQRMIKQAKVLADTARMRANAAAAELAAESRKGISAGDFLRAGLRSPNPFSQEAPRAERTKRLLEMSANVNALQRSAAEARQALLELDEIAALPELGAGVAALGVEAEKGADKASKAAEDNIKAVEDIITAWQRADEQMKNLDQGPEFLDNLDALYTARDAIKDLSAKELAMADEALKKVGMTSGSLEERLASLTRQTEKSGNSIEAFRDLWKEVEESTKDAADATAALNLVLAGGDDADVERLENFQKAMREVSELSPEGIQALLQKVSAMTGVIIASTDPAKDLAQALADIWNSADDSDRLIDALQRMRSDMQDILQEAGELQIETQGLNTGLRDEDLDRWVRRKQAVADFTAQMVMAKVPTEQWAGELERLDAALDTLDQAERMEEQARRFADFRNQASDALAGFALDVVKNFDNILDAAKNLVDSLYEIFMKEFVFKQVSGFFSNLIQSAMGGMGGGGTMFGGGGPSAGLHAAAQANYLANPAIFAAGGLIGGKGTGTSDSNLIRASKGEFMFKAAAVRRWGVSTLEAMNSGRLPSKLAGASSEGSLRAPTSESGMGGRRMRPQTIFNIQTPDANSFRKSERQITRETRRKLGV